MNKRTIIFLLLIGISQFSFSQNNMVKLTDLEGKWYINKSNFPMWLKGDKTFPTFNYTLVKKEKEAILLDKVSFIKNGKEKSINGVDKAQNKNNTEFVWRGNGILKILKSKWEILFLDRKDQWAIIYFEKTLFTPSGYDVISKKKELSLEIEQELKSKLSELNITQSLTSIAQN